MDRMLGAAGRRIFLVALALAVAGCGWIVPPAHAARHSRSFDRLFALVGDYPLGTATTRFDYESLDPGARRLYVAEMGAGRLLAFDVADDRLIAARSGFPKVTGVLAVPALHRVYASVPGAGLVPSISQALGMLGLGAGRGAVAVLSTADLHEIARLPGGVFPDGIAYDPKDRRIFVSDELGAAITVIDAVTDRVIARIRPGGEVGNVRYDTLTGRVYAPIQSRNKLAVIDPVRLRLLALYGLPGARHPHGLLLSPDGAVGYVACDGNDRLLTVDLATGEVVARAPLGHDPDVLAIDPAAKRLYVASESGVLASFDIATFRLPVPLGEVFAGGNAHSVAVDPITHRLYLPLPDVKGQAVMRVLAPKS